MKRSGPMRILTGSVLFLGIVWPASAGQTEKSPASPTPEERAANPGMETQAIKVRVDLVQVKVVVRDAKGKAVKDLNREDFQVYDQGKLQMISTFSVETSETLQKRSEEAAKSQTTGRPVTAETRGMPQRYVAVVIDDVHLETRDVLAVRAGMQQLIESMRPNERIAIFSTSGQMTEQFTSDKEALKARLRALAARPIGGRTNTASTCPQVSYYMADQVINHNNSDALKAVRVEVLECDFHNDPRLLGAAEGVAKSLLKQQLTAGNADNEASYRHLEETLRRLSLKAGERVMILVSPGFLLANLYSEETGLIEKANRAGIVINSVDARGLFSPAAAGNDISKPSSGTQVTSDFISVYQMQEQIEADSVLRDVAESTGGTFFHNSNDLGGGLQQLGAAPEASYLLTYSPDDQKPDGKFHAIKVVLPGHKDYEVQARHGYYATKKIADPEQQAEQAIQDAVYSQNEIGDIPLEIHTRYRKTAGGTAELQVVSHLGMKDLRFRKDNEKKCNKLTVTTVIFDENGEYVSGEEKLVDLQLNEEKYELVSRYGLRIETTFALKPGSYTVREVVRESEGAEMAAKTGEVDIP